MGFFANYFTSGETTGLQPGKNIIKITTPPLAMLVFEMQLTALGSISDSLVFPANVRAHCRDENSHFQCLRQHLPQPCQYMRKCHTLTQHFQPPLHLKKCWWKSNYLKKMILCWDITPFGDGNVPCVVRTGKNHSRALQTVGLQDTVWHRSQLLQLQAISLTIVT